MEEKEVFANLERENKWLGIIDYKVLALLGAYAVAMWYFTGLFNIQQFVRAYFVIITMIPPLGIAYSNKSSNNVVHAVHVIVKFALSRKLYVYNIKNRDMWLK